jgi:hypothetical protein
MTVSWKKKTLLVSVFMLVLLLVIAAPVSALLRTQITLSKNYEFKNVDVSFIRTPDLSDPAISKVEILSTKGDNSDIKTIQQPTINHLTRFFSTMTGSFKGNTVLIEGDQLSTIDYTARPNYRIYTQPVVPTFKVTVPPGAMGPVAMGNPFVAKYNENWDKGDTSSLSALLHSCDIMYLYKDHGLLYQDQATPSTYYIYGPSWIDADYDPSDLTYTLNHNVVSLTPFIADSTKSYGMGVIHGVTKANTGKYYAGALTHDEAARTTYILALTPLVVLKKDTPILWTDDLSTSPLPQSYVKGAMGDVTLSFTGTNPDLGSITNIGYVFINSTAKYDMNVNIDTDLLAQNAEDRWDSYSPGTHVIDLLYDAIRNDVGDPFTYTMTAVGQATPPSANTFSKIAITPGYGISAKTAGTTITIPAMNFASLKNGVYYVYLMGTDANNNIVALDQGLVSIKSGAVQLPKPSTITAFTPTSGIQGSTIDYTLTGTNFESEFGNEGATVNLTRLGSNPIRTRILSLTSTKITGNVTIPADATIGKWNADVFTPDGGRVIKPDAFEVKDLLAPTITSISPTNSYKPNTVAFTLNGNYFETIATTEVKFIDPTNPLTDLTATLTDVTLTKVTGTVTIPAGATTGKWTVRVTTVDGGILTKPAFFEVKPLLPPTITSISPINSYKPNTVAFTLAGNYFETLGTTEVKFIDPTNPATELTATLTSVTLAKITGTVTIPAGATSGKWAVKVTTVDGGTLTKPAFFEVKGLLPPTITSISPINSYKPNTVAFTLNGNYFETIGTTEVKFIDPTNPATELTATLTSVTLAKITGTVTIPAGATSGKWAVKVTTVDGGTLTKPAFFEVKGLLPPTITSISPINSYRNNTAAFTLNGNYFETIGTTEVKFIDPTNPATELTATLTSVTLAKITGTVTIPAGATIGKWAVKVTTVDGGTLTKPAFFEVKPIPIPTITTFTPASGFKNSAVAFTLTGKDFQLGYGTTVQLVDITSGTQLPITLLSVTPTKILGRVNVPAGASAGSYSLIVTTVDVGSTFKSNAFSVTELPVPVITTFTPTSGYRNSTGSSTVSYTLTGKNFQPGGGTTVKLIDTVSFVQIPTTLTSVTSTKVTGVIDIPYNAPATTYTLAVITQSGGFATKDKAFTVKVPLAPGITTFAPTSGYKPSTVAFTLKGSNFQLGGGTKVELVDPTLPLAPLTATIYSTTPGEIIGSVIIPPGVNNGKWSVRATTKDVGPVTKPLAFEVKTLPIPLIISIAPQSSVRDHLVSFTINGDYFQSRTNTHVTFTKAGSSDIATTLTTVYPNRIIGTMVISPTETTGPWTLKVTTDMGFNTSVNAFTIVP